MYKSVLVIALAALAAGAGAQSTGNDGNWQLVSQTQTGARWYVNKYSVRRVGTTGRTYLYFMRGDNPATAAVRSTMVQVKLTCGKGTYAPLHTADFDASGKLVREALKGDISASYAPIPPGSSVDAASRWVCR
jgi:hypothetical protein